MLAGTQHNFENDLYRCRNSHAKKVSHDRIQTAFRDGHKLGHLTNDSAQLIIDLFQQLHAAILVLWRTFPTNININTNINYNTNTTTDTNANTKTNATTIEDA